MRGITAYGAYVPYFRLQRADIAAALAAPAGAGCRAVAGHDEDTTSLGVEAARNALTCNAPSSAPTTLLFATASPAYLDKNNASAIHAALQLDDMTASLDVGGALRSGVGSLLLAFDVTRSVLAVSSDVRTGRPGGDEEATGGDAAAAFVVADADERDLVACLAGRASSSLEVMDRWRIPGADASDVWEERFAAAAYRRLVESTLAAALKDADAAVGDIDVAIVAGSHERTVRMVESQLASCRRVADRLGEVVGNAGSAQAGVLLCSELDAASPGDTILLVNIADGVDVVVLQVLDGIERLRPSRRVADWLSTTRDVSYLDFLTWRGRLDRQPPRRPAPTPPSAPPSARAVGWKYGLVGARDRETGAINLPPQRISYDAVERSGAVDLTDPIRMAEAPARLVTFSVDRLAYSPAPPLVSAMIDFVGGGRMQCELTDVDASALAVGDSIEMTFRRTLTAGGIHNYFWKGRPVRAGRSADTTEEH